MVVVGKKGGSEAEGDGALWQLGRARSTLLLSEAGLARSLARSILTICCPHSVESKLNAAERVALSMSKAGVQLW